MAVVSWASHVVLMARKRQKFHSAWLVCLKFSTWNDVWGYIAVLKARVVQVAADGPRISYFNSWAKYSLYLHVVNVCMSRSMCFVLLSRQKLLGSICPLYIMGAKKQVLSQNRQHLFDISSHWFWVKMVICQVSPLCTPEKSVAKLCNSRRNHPVPVQL